jgi:hypothetical protein
MKTKLLFPQILCFCLLFSFYQGNAQLLKKLQNRITEKVENVVIESTSDQIANKTSNSLDKLFSADLGSLMQGKNKVDAGRVPDVYDFSWIYTLNIQTKEGSMPINYHLEQGQQYFGFNMPGMDNIFIVMDNGRKMTITYMKSEENSMGTAMEMPDDLDTEESGDGSEDFNFQSLDHKVIMGYNCRGVRATNSRYDMVMYFTSEAPVSFNEIYKNDKAKIPAGLKNYFNPNEPVLMMEMQMTDLKNSKLDATIKCTDLRENAMSVNKSDYKFM